MSETEARRNVWVGVPVNKLLAQAAREQGMSVSAYAKQAFLDKLRRDLGPEVVREALLSE